MEKYNIVIVGAGSSGLFLGSLMNFKNKKLKILIIEGTAHIGTKLLISGSGQCNLTNTLNIKEFPSHYNPEAKKIRSILYKFSNTHMMSYLESLGLKLVIRPDGKVFPKSLKSSQVKETLLKEIKKNNIEIITSCKVLDFSIIENSKSPTYVLKCSLLNNDEVPEHKRPSKKDDKKEILIETEKLVLATGGMSYPKTGSDGSIFSTLSELGLEIKTPKPSLSPVFVMDYPFSKLSGISFKDVGLTIQASKPMGNCNRKSKIFTTGDLLFTHKNLSGPVILNNSRYMETNDELSINFLYPMNEDEVFQLLSQQLLGKSTTLISSLVHGLKLPKRFSEEVLTVLNFKKISGHDLKKSTLRVLAKQLTNWHFKVETVQGFSQAMATNGGVKLSEINIPSFEAKAFKGLYFIGEMLDVDGDTGGFNLQFAYSSAQSLFTNLKEIL